MDNVGICMDYILGYYDIRWSKQKKNITCMRVENLKCEINEFI